MSLNISSNLVPQVVNNYNAYTGDDKMIGLADEVTLPKIKIGRASCRERV